MHLICLHNHLLRMFAFVATRKSLEASVPRGKGILSLRCDKMKYSAAKVNLERCCVNMNNKYVDCWTGIYSNIPLGSPERRSSALPRAVQVVD